MMKKWLPLSCASGLVCGASTAGLGGEILELKNVTVTGTREAESLAETLAAVGIIKQNDIQFTAPTHPQQLLSQVPGVAVGVTNGEGHTTAIREPFTTSPLYLYLEDGIPTRATGFFNHNALYEINLPQADGELPRTYLFSADGSRETVSGWLEQSRLADAVGTEANDARLIRNRSQAS